MRLAVWGNTVFFRERDDGDDALRGSIVTPEAVTLPFHGGVTAFRIAPRSQNDRHDRGHRHAHEKTQRFPKQQAAFIVVIDRF